MSIKITKQRIKPTKKYNTEGIRKGMKAALDSAATRVKRDLKDITGTWHHSVNFQVTLRIAGEDASARITTDDDVFHFLNKGTKVRYALMSPDWRSKTKPGRMRSGSGGGRLILVSKRKPWRRSRKRWPRPGIKARGWMRDIQRSNTKKFQAEASIARFRGKLLV